MSNWTALLFGILVNVGNDFLKENGILFMTSGIICVPVNIIYEKPARKKYS
jgi:hypothetical protein